MAQPMLLSLVKAENANARSSAMKVQCCVCRKVRTDGKWETVHGPIAGEEPISHGYCPVCADAAFAELRAHHASKARLTKKSTYAA